MSPETGSAGPIAATASAGSAASATAATAVRPRWTKHDSDFAERFGGEPAGVWAAPGRVNVIGEHTDYNDGFVLPMAIDRACYAAAAPREDRVLRVYAAQLGQTVEISLDALVGPGSAADTRGASDPDMSPLAEPAVTGWAGYPVGVAWVLQQAGFPVSGADVYLTSTVPVGAGLSSSAALECATALALAGVSGFELSHGRTRAAHPARGEHLRRRALRPAGPDVLGVRPGRLGAVHRHPHRRGPAPPLRPGRRGRAAARHRHPRLARRTARTATPTAAPPASAPRSSWASGLCGTSRWPNCPRPSRRSTVGLGETFARRVRHVVTEDARVEQFVEILHQEPVSLPRLGHRMMQSHASLRDDYEVSAPELDLAVSTAVAAGAHGARMTGGGFGGSAIALVDRDQLGRRAHRRPAKRSQSTDTPNRSSSPPSPRPARAASLDGEPEPWTSI